MTPSANWTPEERLEVVRDIAEQLAQQSDQIDLIELHRIALDLLYLATMKASFLELNRVRILKEAGAE